MKNPGEKCKIIGLIWSLIGFLIIAYKGFVIATSLIDTKAIEAQIITAVIVAAISAFIARSIYIVLYAIGEAAENSKGRKE